MYGNHSVSHRILRCPAGTSALALLLAAASLCFSPTFGKAQVLDEQVLYRENFDDGQAQDWELEEGWAVSGGELVGRGHRWARYTQGRWGQVRVVFRILTNGLHANVCMNEMGRYAVGFREEGDYLFLHLFKHVWPEEIITLATALTNYEAGRMHLAEIAVKDGHIQVAVNGTQIIDVIDPQPLPSGTIAFESLDGAFTRVDDIVVMGRTPTPAGWTFEGRVFRGAAGEEGSPLQGVPMSLFGSNNPYPDPGVLITRTTTDERGWYGLRTPEGFEFYFIQETDPPGYASVGATTLNGVVRTGNWIEYIVPLEGKTLTGNDFWDRGPDTGQPPPEDRPDLAIRTVDHWEILEGGRAVMLFVRIVNQGSADAPETVVRVEEPAIGFASQDFTVSGLRPGDEIPVEIRLEIPENRRGTTHRFLVTVDPNREVVELDENNNVSMTPEIMVPPIRVPPRRPATPPVVERPSWPDTRTIIGTGIAIIVLVGIALPRFLKIRRRKAWQEKARDEKPLDECQPCTRYCRKIKLDPDPALLKIIRLVLGAQDPVSGEKSKRKQLKVKGKVVRGLNKAVWSHRWGKSLEDLQDQVKPLAEILMQRVLKWLRGRRASRDVFITGCLEGSKLKHRFVLYHCQRRGTVNAWEEDDKWKATVKEERDYNVGTLRVPESEEPGLPKQLTLELAQLLMQLISNV